MSPLSRRACLGVLAAIPAAAFMVSRQPRKKLYEIHLTNQSTGQKTVTPIVFDDIDRLPPPYFRGKDEWDWAKQLPPLILITSYDG